MSKIVKTRDGFKQWTARHVDAEFSALEANISLAVESISVFSGTRLSPL